MSLTPINTTTAKDSKGRYHISSAPQYVTKQGVLQHIDSTLFVDHDDPTSEYRITFGDDWITMTPEERKGTLKEAFIGERHFGHIMDGNLELHPFGPIIRYIIKYSPGVVRVEKGWDFVEAEDVTMGMFVGDLENRFGEENVKIIPGEEFDILEVDLTGVEADENGEINLDPPTVYPSNIQGSAYEGASWSDVVAGVNGSPRYNANFILLADGTIPVGYGCGRAFVEFTMPVELKSGKYSAILETHAAFSLGINGMTVDVYECEDFKHLQPVGPFNPILAQELYDFAHSPIKGSSDPFSGINNFAPAIGTTVFDEPLTLAPEGKYHYLVKTSYDNDINPIDPGANTALYAGGVEPATLILTLLPPLHFGGTSVDTSTGV